MFNNVYRSDDKHFLWFGLGNDFCGGLGSQEIFFCDLGSIRNRYRGIIIFREPEKHTHHKPAYLGAAAHLSNI